MCQILRGSICPNPPSLHRCTLFRMRYIRAKARARPDAVHHSKNSITTTSAHRRHAVLNQSFYLPLSLSPLFGILVSLPLSHPLSPLPHVSLSPFPVRIRSPIVSFLVVCTMRGGWGFLRAHNFFCTRRTHDNHTHTHIQLFLQQMNL